jgi:acyl-CoA thioesterase-1
MVKLIFFGDSICFGQGVSISKGWITRIAYTLERDNNVEITAVNTSLNGRTTRQALEHMPHEVQSQDPDLLVVQYGMNDCNIWATDKGLPRVSKAAFKANLNEIIARGLNFGAKKILLNTNHPTLRNKELLPNAKHTYQESNEVYNEIIREVAAENRNQVILNDIERKIKERFTTDDQLAQLLLPDLLHLSIQGHSVYFELVYPIVLEMINEFQNHKHV